MRNNILPVCSRLACRFPVLVFLIFLLGTAPSGAQERPAGSVYDFPGTWTDDHGQKVSLAQWRGNRVFLTLFYTSCNMMICPYSLGVLQKIQKKLDERSQQGEFVLVSLDAKKDKPRQLARFKKQRKFGENWHLLVGGQEQTEQLARVLKLNNFAMDDHFIHDFRIYVLDGAGNAPGWLPRPLNGAMILTKRSKLSWARDRGNSGTFRSCVLF